MRIFVCVLGAVAMMSLAAHPVRAQHLPPGGGGIHTCPPGTTEPGTADEAHDPAPAPDRPPHGLPLDEQIVPFDTIAWLELNDTNGWIGSFEIQARHGRGEWRVVGTLTSPDGFTATCTVDRSTECDPNAIEDPVLTDVVIADDTVYLYGTVGPAPDMSIVLSGPWSGYEPDGKGFYGPDWLRYFPGSVRDVIGEAASKITGLAKRDLKELTEYYIDVARQVCAPHCVMSFELHVGPDGIDFSFECCNED